MNRRRMIIASLVIGSATLMAGKTFAATAPIDTNKKAGVALGGYDAVAYFADKVPTPGKADFKLNWKDVDWYFASADNMKLFEASPEKYAPQYGGYCAYAAAKGSVAAGDPEAWSVVDGKLYINLSPAVQKLWQSDIPGYILKADKNWPNLIK